MVSYVETRFIDSLKKLNAKYAKLIPAEYQEEFEQDVYGIWKNLEKAQVLQAMVDYINEKRKVS